MGIVRDTAGKVAEVGGGTLVGAGSGGWAGLKFGVVAGAIGFGLLAATVFGGGAALVAVGLGKIALGLAGGGSLAVAASSAIGGLGSFIGAATPFVAVGSFLMGGATGAAKGGIVGAATGMFAGGATGGLRQLTKSNDRQTDQLSAENARVNAELRNAEKAFVTTLDATANAKNDPNYEKSSTRYQMENYLAANDPNFCETEKKRRTGFAGMGGVGKS
jgi:hypothetical protein